MEIKDKIQKICEQYGIKLDGKRYKYGIGLIDEARNNDKGSVKEVSYYRDVTMEHAVSVSMRLVKNEKGIKVPSWFQEAVYFSFDFYKQKIVLKSVSENSLGFKMKNEVLNETEDNEEFYKEVLPSEAFKIYKMKKVFHQQEAEFFAKGEIDRMLPDMIKNLNRKKRIDRMSREIYAVVKQKYV